MRVISLPRFLLTVGLLGLLMGAVALPADAQIAHLERIKGAPKPGGLGGLAGGDGNDAPDCDMMLIPAPGDTAWNELFPFYNTERVQDNYVDTDLDTFISVGDTLFYNGGSCVLEFVGADYFLTCFTPIDTFAVIYATDLGFHNPVNPVGETWQEIYPAYGQTHLITGFIDTDFSGGTSQGDTLFSGSIKYSIDVINCAIDARVTGGTKIPTLQEWGFILLLLLVLSLGVWRMNRQAHQRV